MPNRDLNAQNQLLFSSKAATGVSPVFDCAGFSNITVAVTCALNSALTFKFQGSVGASVTNSNAPDFNSTQAEDNMWDYVASYDYQDPTSVIVGDTGVVITSDTVANDTRMYIVNVSLIRYFSLALTAFTAGSLSAVVVGSTI